MSVGVEIDLHGIIVMGFVCNVRGLYRGDADDQDDVHRSQGAIRPGNPGHEVS